MHGRAPCQNLENDDDNSDEDELSEKDVLDAILSMIGEIAPALGDNILPYLDASFPVISTCFDPNAAYLNRAAALGMLSDVFPVIGTKAGLYVDRTLPLIENGLRDDNMGVRQNAAFGLRQLCAAVDGGLQSQYTTFMQVFE